MAREQPLRGRLGIVGECVLGIDVGKSCQGCNLEQGQVESQMAVQKRLGVWK